MGSKRWWRRLAWWCLLELAALVAILAGGALAAEPAAGEHDKAFWSAIVADEYSVPEGADPFALTLELSGYLGARDPELRDGFGYTIRCGSTGSNGSPPSSLARCAAAGWPT